jgi:lipopolysaccharide/colanic/teichoic acid biosynthesis glycosyltransferase
MQRLFDILISVFALALLSPLLIPIALLLRFTGEGEIFFLQERIGRGGHPFLLCKFATMLKNSPSMGTGTVTVKDDPRVLPVGGFLRTTKINELPQLLNVLLGDMSLIGPRPLTQQTFGAYSAEVQATVSAVRPGLSGIGSIIFRDEEGILSDNRGSIDFYKNVIAPYKGQLEQWYVANGSTVNYFKAIFVTLYVVFSPKSTLPWRAFDDLPVPPEILAGLLNYPQRQ